MKRKCLAAGIILLFIGVAIAPSINSSVVKASNDLVEVTSQACGIQGFGNTTVKLTKEQYQNLEQYLVEFRARLNQTTTRDEAVPIFKDAVVELNKYGLLPKGMSVEQAQRFIVNSMSIEKHSIFSQRMHPAVSSSNVSQYNLLCLIAGKTNVTYSQRFISEAMLRFSWYAFNNWWLNMNMYKYPYLFVFTMIFLLGLLTFWSFITTVNNINPLALFDIITIGYIDYWSRMSFGYGWVQSFGLLGIKRFDGNLMGAFTEKITVDTYETIWGRPAIYGFTGFKIFNTNDSSEFYLGFALMSGIDVE